MQNWAEEMLIDLTKD